MKHALPLRRRWRVVLGPLALFGVALASPASSSDGQGKAASFAGQFANYDIPQQSHEVAENAVDIGSFEPPVEASSALPTAQALGEGMASYYGRELNGRRTASGETFDMHALTAAHRNLPFGTKVRVTNLANDRSVVVRINDRGPFSRKRLIDLSRAAAEEIGLVSRGQGKVRLELFDE